VCLLVTGWLRQNLLTRRVQKVVVSLCGLPKVVVEDSPEARTASNAAGRRIGPAQIESGFDDSAAEALVVALGSIVLHELAEQVLQVAFPEDDEVVQAFAADRSEGMPRALLKS
jgi:hypothetical protein